jgi:hypothetical protein
VHRVPLTAIRGLLIAFLVSRPLGAQDRTIVELGGSLVRFQADTVETAGVHAHLSRTGELGPLLASASAGALAGAGGVSGFADLSGRWLGRIVGVWRPELTGELGALVVPGARSSSDYASSGLLSVRLLRPVGAGGVWLRGSGNLAQRRPDLLAGNGIGTGLWWRWPGLDVVASVAREWNVAQLFLGAGREGYVGTVPVAYTEGALGLRVERDAATLAVSGTIRRDPGAEHLVERGVSATATFWHSPTRALVVNVVSQLPDFVRGGDALQSVSVGIRWNEASPAVGRALRVRPIILVSGDSAARTVRVRAPGARRVEIMGDFSDWAPITLAPSGDVFSLVLPIAAGTRRVVVRVDGGEWVPAANTPAVDDDFGGRVGLLVVL